MLIPHRKFVRMNKLRKMALLSLIDGLAVH